MKIIVALVALLAAWGGGLMAGGGDPVMSTAESQAALRANPWELVQLPASPRCRPPSGRSSSSKRTFRVTGYSGCNRIGDAYEVGGASLTFGEIILTHGACLEVGRQETENAFSQALEATRSFCVQDGALSLLSADGALLARLVPRAT